MNKGEVRETSQNAVQGPGRENTSYLTLSDQLPPNEEMMYAGCFKAHILTEHDQRIKASFPLILLNSLDKK